MISVHTIHGFHVYITVSGFGSRFLRPSLWKASLEDGALHELRSYASRTLELLTGCFPPANAMRHGLCAFLRVFEGDARLALTLNLTATLPYLRRLSPSIPMSSYPPKTRHDGGAGKHGAGARDAENKTLNSNAKRQYNEPLSQLRAIFPDWAEQDLMSVLEETKGDIELAVARVSEGTQAMIFRACTVLK